MALRVKTFRISDSASEDAFNQFVENKIVRHWGTSHDGDSSTGSWSVLIAFEDRPDDRRENPRRNDHDRRDQDRAPRGDRGNLRKDQKPVVRERAPKPEFVVNLPEADMPLYEAMRKWRNARAKEHDIKPYMFINNKQIEWLVREKPQTKEALRVVLNEMEAEQFEKYQDELLGFLSGAHGGSSVHAPAPRAAENVEASSS